MSVVSQFMHNLKKVYLQVVFRILKYLKGILGMEIIFRKVRVCSLKPIQMPTTLNQW